MKHVIFLCKKLVIFAVSLFLVSTATFFLMHLIPGDPFTQDRALSEEVLASMRSHYGLDKPLFIQYVTYLKNLCLLDLGISLKYEGRGVSSIIAEAFPISLYLGLAALSLAVFWGILLGAFSALRRGTKEEKLLLILTTLGISIPGFLLATLLQYLFAIKFHLFPVARWGSFMQAVLPSLSLATVPCCFIAKLSKTSMVEVLYQDYILLARAKGLSPITVLLRHVLRNSLLPVVSYLGPVCASIFTGAFAVEKIFAIPGLGQWFVLSIANRDYTMIMGITLFYSALLLFCVFLSDLLCALLDPRVNIKSPGDLFL